MSVRRTGRSPAPPRRPTGAFRPASPAVEGSSTPGPDIDVTAASGGAAGAATGARTAAGTSAPPATPPADRPLEDEAAAAPVGADLDEPPATAPADPPALAWSGVEATGRETRRDLRALRRRRRLLLTACAAVVAACLALTILVVSMARQRPSGLPAWMTSSSATAVVLYP